MCIRDSTNTNVGVTTFSGFTHIKTAVINTAYQTIESTATNSYPYLRLKNDAREYQLSCHGGQSDSFNIYDGTAAAYRFTITSSGKVGINQSSPTISQFEVKSAQLGGTAGNTQEVVRLYTPDVTNTTSYRFTNYRVSNGTSHSSSELRFRRHVDATDMGYLGLGDGYVSIGYGTAERLRIASDGKLSIDRTHASATTGNHPALDIDTYANGTAGATFATGIDFRVAGVHKKRLAITNADSSVGTGDWIFYRDNGSNIGMQISSAGHVTKPNQPMFSAKGTTDAISAASPLPFDSTDYNVGNHYSTSTYKFTCPVSGYYYVTCHVVPTGFSNSNQNVELYVQNTAGTRFFLDRKVKTTNYASNNFSVGGSRIIYAAANDTFCVEFNSISGSPTLEGSSHFGIMLMA